MKEQHMKTLYIALLLFPLFLFAQIEGIPLSETERIFKLEQKTDKNTQQSKQKAKMGDKNLRSKLDEIIFFIRMPVSWTHEGAKVAKLNNAHSVKGVLAICTHHAQERPVKENLLSTTVDRFASLLNFADENDLAVITWSMFGGFQQGVSGDEMTHAEYKEYEKTFNDRLSEWERGFKRMISLYNLPSDAIIMYGISNGAQMAHRIVLRRPQYFSGIHIHVNSSYDKPTAGAEKVLWLVSTGDDEYGYPAGIRFYQKMLDMKYSVIFKVGANLGHADREDIQALSMEFFKYLLSFVPDARDKNWKAPPVDKFYLMKYPIYIGDYLNHVVYPLENAEKYIEKDHMIALPTRPIAEAWGPIIE